MLSRRNVRIKVMQILYSMNRDKKLKANDALARYHQSVSRSYELYLFSLWQLLKIAEFAQKDEERRKAKLLPTEFDKMFTAKLWTNPLVQSIHSNRAFTALVKKHQLDTRIDNDSTRLVYIDFSKSDTYKKYLAKRKTSLHDHKTILLDLYKHCLNNELFDEIMDDNYSSWIDDKSLIVGTMKKTIKALPAKDSFHEKYRPTPETTVEFGEELFQKVADRDLELLGYIEPSLKNWDAERVAIVDMILLKMALTELMIFPTIPTKVTLNEFVEISKLYSTDKSKDFINGILDRLMKKLEKDGKIAKEGRGLVE